MVALQQSLANNLPVNPSRYSWKPQEQDCEVINNNFTVHLLNYPAATFSLFKSFCDVDSSVMPGDSFYQFTNKPWVATNSIPSQKV